MRITVTVTNLTQNTCIIVIMWYSRNNEQLKSVEEHFNVLPSENIPTIMLEQMDHHNTGS